MFDLNLQQLVFRGYCRGFSNSKGGDGKKTYSYSDVQNYMSYGASCLDNVVDVSFDDLTRENTRLSDRILDIIDAENVSTYALYSPHGVHTYWRIPDVLGDIKDGIVKLACGVVADIHHKNTYIPLQCDGVERKEVYENLKLDILPELPEWLYPIGKAEENERYLWQIGDGDGRNNALSSHAFLCANHKVPSSSLRKIFNIINKYVFKAPLPPSEIDTILRDETIEKLEAVPNFFDEKQKFLHEIMGEYLIEKYNICKIDGVLHLYNGVFYEKTLDDLIIERQCSDLIPRLVTRQRKEVVNYIKLYAPSKHPSSSSYITFANGVYDIENDRLLPLDKSIVDVTYIPWNFTKNAKCELVDDTLDKLTCNDADIKLLLEEALGYSLCRRNELGAVFFIDGVGSNGKSTFYAMLENMVSKRNTASLDITQVAERFMTQELHEKLINIGGDVTKCHLSPSEIACFKKLATGDEIQADIKNSKPISFSNYAKLFFACNGMPNLTSEPAVMRRLKIIPFNAKFDKKSKDFDPYIIDKLTTRDATEYLIQIAIRGLKRLLKNGFTEPKKVTEALEQYDIDSDSMKAFVVDYGEDNIIGKTPGVIRDAYNTFCSDAGYKYPKSWKTVANDLKKFYGIVSKPKKISGVVFRVYSYDSEDEE